MLGGFLGLPGAWRALGVFALAPFTALVGRFAQMSGGTGTCEVGGNSCSASLLTRFGGLAVILASCAFAAVTERAVVRQRLLACRRRRNLVS